MTTLAQDVAQLAKGNPRPLENRALWIMLAGLPWEPGWELWHSTDFRNGWPSPEPSRGESLRRTPPRVGSRVPLEGWLLLVDIERRLVWLSFTPASQGRPPTIAMAWPQGSTDRLSKTLTSDACVLDVVGRWIRVRFTPSVARKLLADADRLVRADQAPNGIYFGGWVETMEAAIRRTLGPGDRLDGATDPLEPMPRELQSLDELLRRDLRAVRLHEARACATPLADALLACGEPIVKVAENTPGGRFHRTVAVRFGGTSQLVVFLDRAGSFRGWIEIVGTASFTKLGGVVADDLRRVLAGRDPRLRDLVLEDG